jgi:DNA-binding PadR family transcriptional regulator
MSASKVEVVVLGLLAEGSLHGYDLLERFRERSMGFWVEVGKASVYQALRRLERDAAVVGRSQAGPAGPDRRVYRITKSGRERLRAGLMERFEVLGPYETEGGLALGFVEVLSAAEAGNAVDAREAAVRDLLDAIETERMRNVTDTTVSRAVSSAMLDRQEAFARAELGWIETFRAGLGRIRR